jgi:hypothetical protein
MHIGKRKSLCKLSEEIHATYQVIWRLNSTISKRSLLFRVFSEALTSMCRNAPTQQDSSDSLSDIEFWCAVVSAVHGILQGGPPFYSNNNRFDFCRENQIKASN